MKITWLVARRELLQRLRNRGFWMSAAGTPVLLLVIMLASGRAGMAAREQTYPHSASAAVEAREGYVDEASLLSAPLQADSLEAFADEAQAAAALRAGEIDAYYVIAPDYRETGDVTRVSVGLPVGEPDDELFEILLSEALVSDRDAATAFRLVYTAAPEGITVVAQQSAPTSDGVGEMSPFFVLAAVMLPLFAGGGLLLRGLSQEKEQRIMEPLLIALSPRQLLMGKLLGLGLLIALQYVGWFVVMGLAGGLASFDLASMLSGVHLGTTQLVLLACYAVGGFVLYAALMAGLGAITPDVHSGQSWVFIISLPMMVPMYLWLPLSQAPQSPLAVALSLIPFSAPIAMVLRVTVAQVPLWQVALSLALVAVTAVFTVRLMARLFRAQVLLSGEALSLQRIMRALRA